MKKIISLIFCLFCSSVIANNAADILQKKLNSIKTMKAKFKQVVKADKRVVSNSTGKMALSRPGKFRWDTKSPMPQLVIADGKKMWVYDVDLEQVTVRKQKKSLGGTAALFLSGYDDTVARDYNVSLRKTGQLQYFDMKSKQPEKGFQRVIMTFKGNLLTGLNLYDQLGQITQVKLINVQLNPKLSQELFKFTPPNGVDVVKQ